MTRRGVSHYSLAERHVQVAIAHLEPHQKGCFLAEFAEAAEGRRHLFPFLPENAPDTAFQRKEWVDIPEE